MIGFLIGIIVGGCLGFMVTALLFINNITRNKGGNENDD